MKIKKQYQLFLLCFICAAGVQAQGGTSVKKQAEYTIYMKLQRGEKLIPLHSCMWLNEKNELNRLVIQSGNNKYSVIEGGGRTDDLSSLEMYRHTSSDCSLLDPHRPRKLTQYVGRMLVKANANGTKVISSGNKSYGPFQEILFMEELGQRFVAVVKALKNGKSKFRPT